ncbi:baseplate J/gp47 family protein [Pseudomonas sp. MF4836]|uniref:baseplate J/gp47 family protein n=1 Tax=Pseudomonas sp. MF4836 TaxID=1960827 RepID=UPI000995DF3D|nr:baseplate J/gp47 family protein [Pseudomonas sp. MF4836]OOV92132.1 phage tail protein [Pseudomonas sp. MF4836]
MAYSGRSLDAILRDILRDIRNLQAEADIGPDSDNYVRSAAVASAIEGLYQKLAWLYRQIFPDTADEEELVHTAALRGVLRKDAVAATGTVALKGTPDVELLLGATLKHVVAGELFTAISSAKIGIDGTATVLVEAQTVGVALNDLVGALTLTSPPLGMDAASAFVGKTTGGEDQETIESLLARYLDIIQSPPAGGADYDYRRWALEVDGVADALVIPRRRGGGTVDIVITGSNGAPSAEVIAACLAHIQSQCSVIVDVWVYAPTERTVDSAAKVELAPDFTLADVQAAAQKAYNILLGALKPGDTLKRSQIEAMINNLAGVLDRAVAAPAGNVKASDDPALIGWIRPGVIILGLLG